MVNDHRIEAHSLLDEYNEDDECGAATLKVSGGEGGAFLKKE